MATAQYSRNKAVGRRAPHTERTLKISMCSHRAKRAALKPARKPRKALSVKHLGPLYVSKPFLTSEAGEGAAPWPRSSRIPRSPRQQCYSLPHHALPGTGYTTRAPACLPRLISSSSGSPRQLGPKLSGSLSFPRPEEGRGGGAMFAGH